MEELAERSRSEIERYGRENNPTETEIRRLERLFSSFFDYVEDLIERENAFATEAFAASVDQFLAFREYKILPDKGRISKRRAEEKTAVEYDAFNKTQKIVSDSKSASPLKTARRAVNAKKTTNERRRRRPDIKKAPTGFPIDA